MPATPDSLQGKFFCTHFGHSLTGAACVGRQEADPRDEDGLFFCTRGLCDQGKAVAKACGVAVKRWETRQAEQLRPPAASPTGGHFQHRRTPQVGRPVQLPRDTGPRIPSASERPPEPKGGVPAWKAAEERIKGITPAKLAPNPLAGRARPAPAPKPRPAEPPRSGPWSKKAPLAEALGGVLEPTEDLLEELADETLQAKLVDDLVDEDLDAPEPPARAAPADAKPAPLTETKVKELVGSPPPAARPLAGEPITLVPGARLTFASTAAPAAALADPDGDQRRWPAPPDIPLRPKTPPAPAAAAPPTPPAPPAQVPPPMVTAMNTNQPEKRLCKRCEDKPLRVDNRSGICNGCRLELGSPEAVQAWLKENAEEGKASAAKPAAAVKAARPPPQAEPLPASEARPQQQPELPGMPPPAAPLALPDFSAAPPSFLMACAKAIKAEAKRRAAEIAELTKVVSESLGAGE